MSGRRLPGPERRVQLLGAARSVLAENGYHETSMNDIAAAAGVTKPVLYQHFESKRELFGAVLIDVGQQLQANILGAAGRVDSPRAQVEAGIQAYVRYIADDPDGSRLLFGSTSREDAEWSKIATSVENSLVEAIARLIEVDGLSHESRIALAHGVVGTAESMMRYWRSHQESLDKEELITHLTSMIWGGLRSLG